MKNVLFLIVALFCLPFAIVGAVAGLVMCGLRGGYLGAESFARWLTE